MQAEFNRDIMNVQASKCAEIRDGFIKEIDAQIRLSQMLSSLFPPVTFVLLTSDIAQTGIESERNFLRAALRYRRQYSVLLKIFSILPQHWITMAGI